MHRISNQSGQVAVLVAMLSVALISSLALAVDVGAAYEARRTLQTSVDAAALAGAQDIAEERGEAEARLSAEKYVRDNSRSALEGLVVSFPDSSSVHVEANVDENTFFARLFGRQTMTVKAGATASGGSANTVDNLVPIIVPYQSVAGHIGLANEGEYELGADRPMDDLSITYTQVGNQVTYTVAYINTWNQVAKIEMWSPVPAGADYVDGSATSGGVFNGGTLSWVWENVASGDRRSGKFTVTFSGTVNPRNDVTVKVTGSAISKTKTVSTNDAQRGYFWLVDFDGGSHGTQDFAQWIVNGYPNPVGVRSLANGTGVRAALDVAMAARLAKDPSIVLPLYDQTEGGGAVGTYHVVGFAEFVITGYKFNGNPKKIKGYFTNGTVTPGAGGNDSQVDFGVRVIWLSE